MDRAKDKCELCGKSAEYLTVRTNLLFSYSDYLKTGEILDREISVVCPRCSRSMVLQLKENNRKRFVEYICFAPSGEMLEYQV